MAPTSIVFLDPLFLFQTPNETMNRGFTVFSKGTKYRSQSNRTTYINNKVKDDDELKYEARK
jgi:hypothetical protein